MSDYGSDTEDVELELSRVKTRHTIDTPAQRTQYKRLKAGFNIE